MLFKLRSAVARMIRRREYKNNNNNTEDGKPDMTNLSSLNTRCLHTNDKRLLRILFVVLCFSVLLQRSLMPAADRPITADTQFSSDAQGSEVSRRRIETSPHDVTLVTAYFDIGTFDKGTSANKFSPDTYRKWARVFRYVRNPLIVYTDAQHFADLIKSVRNESMSLTRIYLIDRNSSWAFQRREKVQQVFKQPHYPKFKPNTVIPDYACAQIAKYDVISRAAKANIFNTDYIMWIDVGYFRDRKSKEPFKLKKPKDFDDSKVAMNLVYFNRNMSETLRHIFMNNLVWVGGGLVFGTPSTIIAYEQQLMRAVDYFMSIGLMNTDQQLNYAMFSDEGRHAVYPEVEIQIYKPPHEYDWFYLGNSMVKELDRTIRG